MSTIRKTPFSPLISARVDRPLAFALAAAACCILGYCLYLGISYLEASQRLSGLAAQGQSLTTTLSKPSLPLDSLSRQFAAEQQQIAVLKGGFSAPATDQIIGAVIATAQQAGTAPLSVTAGETSVFILDNVQYQTLPVSLTLQGGVEEVSSFLSNLKDSVPEFEVSNLRVSGAGGTSVAQLQLTIYTSPQEVPPKKSIANATPTPVQY